MRRIGKNLPNFLKTCKNSIFITFYSIIYPSTLKFHSLKWIYPIDFAHRSTPTVPFNNQTPRISLTQSHIHSTDCLFLESTNQNYLISICPLYTRCNHKSTILIQSRKNKIPERAGNLDTMALESWFWIFSRECLTTGETQLGEVRSSCRIYLLTGPKQGSTTFFVIWTGFQGC